MIALCVLFFCSIAMIIAFHRLSISSKPTAIASIISKVANNNVISVVNEIELPEGYERIAMSYGSFGEWLQQIKLRKDNTVYLYNGKPLADQTLHYAVLDFSTGTKDLQQCADVIMRLRSEYYFSSKDFNKIEFKSGNKIYNFQEWLKNISSPEQDKHKLLLQFLETVFNYCGTYTIDEMTKPINMQSLEPGDVFIKAGSPGHAMIIIDAAVDKSSGKKIYLLAQGYMPAQDMHIVINPNSSTLNPWYEVTNDEKIITPGWIFTKDQLKRWK